MRRRYVWQYLLVILTLTVAGFPGQPAGAQDPPPPAPAGTLEAASIRAQPVAAQGLLYDQMNSASANWISSQNSLDTFGAADFAINDGSTAWLINAVEVGGLFYQGTHSDTSVHVAFYSDAGGRPGSVVYAANSQPISGTASSGNFFLPLNNIAFLIANRTYWVSVQAIQTTSGTYWAWSERTTQTLNRAMWQNPNNRFNTGCTSWTAINVCFAISSPDLLFRLYGSKTANPLKFVNLPLVRR
jgi:hypothetical protein